MYVNTLFNPFVYDDLAEIVGNASIRELRQIGVVLLSYPTRPLTNLSYAIDFAFSGGVNTLAFHTTNIALHVVNVLLLFFLVRRLVSAHGGNTFARDQSTAVGFAVASVFAVHPLLTEAVGFTASRSELLTTAGFLGSLTVFVSGVASGFNRNTAIGTALLFLLALTAKETAVVLPALLWVLDVLVVRPAPADARRRFWRLHLPLNGLVVLATLGRIWLYVNVEHSGGSGIHWERIPLELHILQRYVELLFVPMGLSLVPAVPELTFVRIAGGVATLLLLLLVAGFARKREPLVTFGILWFLLALAPSAALVVIEDFGHPMAEHRVYLPGGGFLLSVALLACCAVAWGGSVARWRTAAAWTAFAVVIIGFSGATMARNRIWSDPVRLWTDAARKAPGAWVARYGLAEAHRTEEDCAAASDVYRQAIALRPEEPAAYTGLAACLVEQGQAAQAREQLRIALGHAPGDINTRLALAALEAQVFSNAKVALTICQGLTPDRSYRARVAECIRENEQRLSVPGARREIR